MEKIIAGLKSVFTFKEVTEVGDIVLILAEEPQVILYALVMDIERDSSKKDEWWHVSFQFLTLPPQQTVWTLRTSQFSGQEIFTMGGKKKFIQAVSFSPVEYGHGEDSVGAPKAGGKKTGGLRLVK
ncbi:MAG: hypothetical protein OEL55_05025 [Desulfobulbaceae bacterium]|nr:hypothetical protein [Desulfobulbaceae bacterium]